MLCLNGPLAIRGTFSNAPTPWAKLPQQLRGTSPGLQGKQKAIEVSWYRNMCLKFRIIKNGSQLWSLI